MLAALVAATTATTAGTTPPAEAVPSASFFTRSYYMGDGSGAAARYLGCANGDKQGRMTLFFGSPTAVSGTYGATLWGAPNRTTSQVAATVKEVARGYVMCRESSTYRLLIGVGTSNSSIDGRSDTWLRGHGRAWATMVKNLSGWATAHYPDHVRIYAAWDAEPSWSRFSKAESWMHGYDDTTGARPLFANFSADGCPRTTSNNGSCNNGWNQQGIWHLAWQHNPAMPFPQIYATSGANANQWQRIDEYGASRGNGMFFTGAMSQWTACWQAGEGCWGIDATPRQSHDFLLWALNSREATRQPAIEAVTDIRWHS
ncbi:MAG TPA: hypothetical protein VF743_02085 [Acidimicrobiales bacterium]